MNRFPNKQYVICSVVLSVLLSASLIAEEPEIRVSEVKGTCEVQIPDEDGTTDSNEQQKEKQNGEKQNKKQNNKEKKEWKKAEAGMILPANTEIATGFESRVSLQIGDMGMMVVKPLTVGILGDLISTKHSFRGSIKLKTGSVRVHLKEREVKASFNVKTPRVVAAVKGSIVEVLVRNDKGDSVRVLEGHLEATGEKRSQSLTRGQETETVDNSSEYYRAIVQANLRHLADIKLDGQIHTNSIANLQEFAEHTVSLMAGDFSQQHGGDRDFKIFTKDDSQFLLTTPKENRSAVADYVEQLNLSSLNDLARYLETGDSTALAGAVNEVDTFHARYGVDSLMNDYFHNIYLDFETGEGSPSTNPRYPSEGPGREILQQRLNGGKEP